MFKPIIRPIDAFALLVLTIASIIGINQYTYGVYNHCITIPFIKSLINPEIYNHDYLIAEKQFFYTYFLPVCGFLIQSLKASLPVTFFVLYFLSLYATLAALFLIALKLFEKREVAYLSVMILLFSITTLGMERTIENMLMERTFALPLLLFSFYAFFGSHYNTAAVLAGIAFVFHPLSACYALAILIMCFAYRLLKENGARQFVTGIGLILLAITPILILKIKNPAPNLSLISVSSEWLELLHLRSAHHIFPTTWSVAEVLQGIALILGFLITWKYRPQAAYHRIVLIAFATVLLMFVVGTIFTEIIPVSIVIQFQLFRSFKFIFFFAIIYFANYLFTAPNTASGIAKKLFVTLLILAPYWHESIPVITGISLLVISAIAAWALLEKTTADWKKYLVPAQIMLLLLLGIAGSLNRVQFSISNSQNKEWLSVQQWARENTPQDAAFIVPPYMEGFRVESERTLYGEWKDGTQMIFNPSFGHEWMRRMENLGYKKKNSTSLKDAFQQLTPSDFEKVAIEMSPAHSKIFAVVPAEIKNLNFPVSYSNEKFSVMEISSGSSVQVVDVNLIKNSPHELVAQSAQISN
ncbi:MAG: DUF6798 domain-containing protein [Chitinophagales bacterium]|nr:DUF6798 domain-containing protein [Chitinophagales bacterium]